MSLPTARITYVEGARRCRIDPMRVARVLAQFDGRTVRPSTIARAMADDFEGIGVDRAEFIAAAGGGRPTPNRRRHADGS